MDDLLTKATKMAQRLSDKALLALYLKLEALQWDAVSNDDKDEARDYRNRHHRLLSRLCGRYQEADYKRELAFYVVNLQERKKLGTLAKHINAVSANDYYLENYQIIAETANDLSHKEA